MVAEVPLQWEVDIGSDEDSDNYFIRYSFKSGYNGIFEKPRIWGWLR